ncbi:MAG: aspartate-alanine antiporter [Pseudomonadota bacterium]
MLEKLHHILINSPLLVLFITIALGYFVGKFRIKTFVLGGIAGSLIVGVLIGQLGVKIPAGIGSIFFALFIYAVGYQGGPAFFRSLNRETGIQLVSATMTCVLGLLCVLIAAWVFHLDRGTAAGLAAGGLTQSAMIGTAGDAIARLHLPAHVIQAMQANVAVGYAVCYIFGSFGPIIMLTAIFPAMMRWNIRAEAKKLAQKTSGRQSVALEPGQFQAIADLDTRVYKILPNSTVINHKISELFNKRDIAIEGLMRANKLVEIEADTVLQADDIVAITTTVENFLKGNVLFEQEVAKPALLKITEETREIVLTNSELNGKTVQQFHHRVAKNYYSVFITAISRLGEKLKASDDLVLKHGDDLTLVGRASDLDHIASRIGHIISLAKITDFISFGVGMALGIVLGMLTVNLWGVSLSLGTGGGCLIAGLLFGFLRSRRPRFGALPSGASNFLRDFGLAVFVATVGITAGPEATIAIKQHGLELFLLGIGVTIIPQIITFFIAYYLLKIKNPIEILATIAGGRSANPGFAALLEKAGNATPVVAFTATYTIANIWLTLWGPVIVSLVTKNVH